jgi:ABC-type molybdate transport system, ATPase component
MLYLNIKKQFKTGGCVNLALDIAVTVPEGITIFFGPSGSGKTTVLRAIAGMVTPDEGKIALGERIYFDSAAGVNLPIQKRKVGFVFQDYILFPHLTAEQNVTYGIRPGVNQTKRERAQHLLSLLRVEHTAGRYPRELSGGEQQRVALARALASDPQFCYLTSRSRQ